MNVDTLRTWQPSYTADDVALRVPGTDTRRPASRGRLETPFRLRWRPFPGAPPGAMLVLVPGPLGGLCCFERRGPGRLRCGPILTNARELHDIVTARRHHCVVLCGSRHRDAVTQAAGDRADLYLVPLAWLRSVPRDDQEQLAALAARLVTAFRLAPIHFVPRSTTLHVLA